MTLAVEEEEVVGAGAGAGAGVVAGAGAVEEEVAFLDSNDSGMSTVSNV